MLTINSTAPSTIVYDNSCNLHNYCLNREPKFFKLTWFLIDRFHWPNHCGECILPHINTAAWLHCCHFSLIPIPITFIVVQCHVSLIIGCCEGYNTSRYPQFVELNTQLVEQSNASLKRIKSSLSYMNSTNFLNHCKFFLWYHNREKNRQACQAISTGSTQQ